MDFKKFFKEEQEKREEKRHRQRKLDIEYECQIVNDAVFKRLEDRIKSVITDHFLEFEKRPTIIISDVKLETRNKSVFHMPPDYLEVEYQLDHSITVTGYIFICAELTKEENNLIQDDFRKAVIQTLEADNEITLNPDTGLITIDIGNTIKITECPLCGA